MASSDKPVYISDNESTNDSEDESGTLNLAEGRTLNDVQSQIWRALRKIEVSSDSAVGEHKTSAPNPGLDILGHGIVGLPLSESDARMIISKSKSSSMRQTDHTLPDSNINVDNNWELDASNVSFKNPGWATEVDRYVSSVYTAFQLRCQRADVTAKFCKLYLCKEGASFEPHMNNENVSGIFATLAVCLPSAHEGGSLLFQHGEEQQPFETASNSAFGTSWVAWYSSVTHKAEPLTSGYRLVLIYNIIHESTRDQCIFTPRYLFREKSRLSELLKVYNDRLENGEELPSFLVHKLEGNYLDSPLERGSLTGQDAAQIQALDEISRKLSFVLYLGILELQYEDEGYDEGSHTSTLQGIVSLDGKLLAKTMPIPAHAVIDPQFLDEGEYDEQDLEYDSYGRKYETSTQRDAVIIMIPPSEYPDFVTSPGFSPTETLSFLQATKAKLSSVTDQESPQRQLVEVVELILNKIPQKDRTWSTNSFFEDPPALTKLRNEAALIALDMRNFDAFQTASKRTNGKIVVDNAEAVGRAVIHIGFSSFETPLEQGVKTLSDLESRCHFLREVEAGMQSCSGAYFKTDSSLFNKWSNDVICRLAFESGHLTKKDGITLAKTSKILDWTFFASTVRSRYPAMTTTMKIAFINELMHLRSFPSERASEQSFIEWVIEQTWEKFSILQAAPTTNLGIPMDNIYTVGELRETAMIRKDPLNFLTGEDLNIFLVNSLSQNPSRTFGEEVLSKLLAAVSEASKEVCSSILVPFVKIVLENKCSLFHLEAPNPSPSQSRKALIQSYLATYISKSVPPKPQKSTNWSMPAGNCGCKDCEVVNQFLLDPVRTKLDFPCAEARRKHLDSKFYNSSSAIETIRGRSPFTWRMTKNDSSFRKSMREWESAAREAKATLASLALDEDAKTRLRAYLDPHYDAFSEGQIEKLPEIHVPQPLGEVDRNTAATPRSERDSRKRRRDAESVTPGDTDLKRQRHLVQSHDSAKENAPSEVEVEIFDLT